MFEALVVAVFVVDIMRSLTVGFKRFSAKFSWYGKDGKVPGLSNMS